MLPWLKDRLEILRLALGRPLPLLLFGFFQAAALLLKLFPAPPSAAPFLDWLPGLPWTVWVIGWLLVFGAMTLDDSVERKKRFDKTSANFFKAYLDHLLKEGSLIFQHAGEKDFYSKISDWQRKAVQGIAIGLGPEQSKEFFRKVEAGSPLSEAYRQAAASKMDEPLAKALEARLEELNQIRLGLPENEEDVKNKLTAGGAPAPGPAQPAGLLTGEVESPPSKSLPRK